MSRFHTASSNVSAADDPQPNDDDPDSDSGSSDSDSDSGSSDSDSNSGSGGFAHNLVKLAKKIPKKHAGALVALIASWPIQGKATKRRANDAKADLPKNAETQPTQLWYCGECDEEFTSKDSLKEHQGTCKKEEEPPIKKSRSNASFKCDTCDKTYSNKGNLKRHVRATHGDGSTAAKAFACDTCDKVYTTKACLQRHVEAKHGTGSAAATPFECDKCDKSYTYKDDLQKHVRVKHGQGSAAAAPEVPSQAPKTKPKKYKCTLCNEERADIYKHYGIDHSIECPQQILFDNGTVLTISDVDTDEGKAAWFKNQLEKVMKGYNDKTCRLCDVFVDFGNAAILKDHYTGHHAVDVNCVSKIKRLFRAEKNAHLGETSNPRRVSDKKANVSDTKKKGVAKGSLQNKNTMRIIYKCKCGKTTETYDAAVDHSQDHLVSKGTPGNKTCDIRNSTLEAEIDDDINRESKVIEYDFEKLLTVAWFDMFNDLTESDKSRILSSSVYLHSRSVKIHSENSESTTRAPAYQCGMCQLFVDPAKIVNHCKNYDTCAKNKPKGHYCSECDAHFYSSSALTIHKENHASGFRLLMFNNKNDVEINKILQNNLRSTPGSREADKPGRGIEENLKKQENSKRIQVISDVVVSPNLPTQFCSECKIYVDCRIFEAHTADHQSVRSYSLKSTSESNNVSNSTKSMVASRHNESATGKKTGQSNQVTRVDDERMQTENQDTSTKNDVNGVKNNDGGTVEPWDRDSDSCCSVQHTITNVQADITMSVSKNLIKETVDNGAGSPENDLLQMYGANIELSPSMIEDGEELSSTQELQHILEDASENVANRGLNSKVVSQDMFNDDMTQDNDGRLPDINMTNNERGKANNESQNAVATGVRVCKIDKRMSARDQIKALIQSGDLDLDIDEEEN